MLLITILIVSLYSFFIVRYIIGNNKLECLDLASESTKSVTIVVALRNEKENVEALCSALFSQNYSKQKLEFIFINDHSIDETLSLLEECCRNCQFHYQIVNLTEKSGKKAAITKGVELAEGDFILTTDADSLMGSQWVNAMLSVSKSDQAEFLIGSVQMKKKEGWLPAFQQTEFAAIMACTSGSAALHRAIVCNGANLGFTKELFYKLNPYDTNRDIASGDDIFFLHKAKQNKAKIKFVANPLAIVKTKMANSFSEFMSQRIRWAKKSRYFNDRDSKQFGFILIVIHLLLYAQLFASFYSSRYFCFIILTIGLKFFLDTCLLYSARKWIGLNNLIGNSILLTIVYPVYFLSFALLSLRSKTNWKGREV